MFSDTSKVQTDPNLAFGQPTWQHSLVPNYPGGEGKSDRAVDGRRDSLFTDQGSCSHTRGNVKSPWWVVDLGTSGVAIGNVVVVNRGDCCGKKLLSFSYRCCLDSITCLERDLMCTVFINKCKSFVRLMYCTPYFRKSE